MHNQKKKNKKTDTCQNMAKMPGLNKKKDYASQRTSESDKVGPLLKFHVTAIFKRPDRLKISNTILQKANKQ